MKYLTNLHRHLVISKFNSNVAKSFPNLKVLETPILSFLRYNDDSELETCEKVVTVHHYLYHIEKMVANGHCSNLKEVLIYQDVRVHEVVEFLRKFPQVSIRIHTSYVPFLEQMSKTIDDISSSLDLPSLLENKSFLKQLIHTAHNHFDPILEGYHKSWIQYKDEEQELIALDAQAAPYFSKRKGVPTDTEESTRKKLKQK